MELKELKEALKEIGWSTSTDLKSGITTIINPEGVESEIRINKEGGIVMSDQKVFGGYVYGTFQSHLSDCDFIPSEDSVTLMIFKNTFIEFYPKP